MDATEPLPICRTCFEEIPTDNNSTLTCPNCGTENRPESLPAHQPEGWPDKKKTAPIAVVAATAPKAYASEDNHREPVYFERHGVTVTKSRFMIGSQTFAMANVTSVAALEIPPNRGVALFLVIMIAGLATLASTLLAVVALVLGFIGVYMLKPSYAVQLTTSAGQQKLCSSKDADFVRGIVNALNRSIVERG